MVDGVPGSDDDDCGGESGDPAVLSPEAVDQHVEQVSERPDFFLDVEKFRSYLHNLGRGATKKAFCDKVDGYLDGRSFRDVYDFFCSLAEKIDLNMSFLQDGSDAQEHREEFYGAFWQFMQDVDSKYMLIVKRGIQDYMVDGDRFLERKDHLGWKSQFRKMAYFAFFIHYGQKRKAYIEEDDEKKRGHSPVKKRKPYIRHPMRAATVESLKVGFVDVATLCALIGHDTLEDWHKGMFGCVEKGAEFETAVKDFLKSDIFPPDMLRLIELVTKPKLIEGNKPTRLRASLDLLETLADHVEKGEFEFLRALLVKFPDRLDNAESLHEHEGAKQNAIWNETAYIHLPLAQALGMVNSAEWLRDFLACMDPTVRKSHAKALARSKRNRHNVSTFQQAFAAKMDMGIPQLTLRRDYTLVVRRRGVRLRPGASYNSKDLHHFFIVVPTRKNDPNVQQRATRAFEEIFPCEPSAMEQASLPETATAFGKNFSYRTDISTPHSRFGMCAFFVADGPQDARATFFGDIHLALIDGDDEAKARLQATFERISPELEKTRSLIGQYDVSETVADATQDVLESDERADPFLRLDPAEKTVFRDLLEKRMYLTFVPKVPAKIVYPNGREAMAEVPFVQPEGNNLWSDTSYQRMALWYHDPSLVFFNFICTEGDDGVPVFHVSGEAGTESSSGYILQTEATLSTVLKLFESTHLELQEPAVVENSDFEIV